MRTHNADNERIKRRYFAYLNEAKRHSEPTVDAVAKALDRFEVDTKYRDFKSFHFEQHSFRNTLVRLGQTVCPTTEAFKAWSQNLGHDKVLTTLLSYGHVESSRQGEIIRGLATPQLAMQPGVSELAKALFREWRDSGVEML